jgi:hypothetical protein
MLSLSGFCCGRPTIPCVIGNDQPSTRDFIETISTLAHLSRFIIADLTDSPIAQALSPVSNFNHLRCQEVGLPLSLSRVFVGRVRAPHGNMRRTELAGSAIVPFSTSGRSEPPLSFTNIREDLGLNAFRATA